MGLVNTVMVSVKLFPGGVENKGRRLAPGAINNTLFSLPEGADLSPLNLAADGALGEG